MDRYCLGFCFDRDAQAVLLAKKNRPEWQAGRLNGLGGKKKRNETYVEAMVREFREESGYFTETHDWTEFATMEREGDFKCVCFFLKLPLIYKTTEVRKVNPCGETNHWIKVSKAMRMDHLDIIDNVPTLLMALEDQQVWGEECYLRLNYT